MTEKPREYQMEQVEAVISACKKSDAPQCVGSAVGTGKGFLIAELCRIAKRPLVVVPNLPLLYQMHETLARRLGEEIDIEQADNSVRGQMLYRNRVTLATRQSLTSRDRHTLFGDRTLTMVDECHIGFGKTDGKLPGAMRWLQQKGSKVVGLTATPFTASGGRLEYWAEPCWYRSMLDFIRDGWLCRPKVTLLDNSGIDWSVFDEMTFNEYTADELMAEEGTAHEIVNAVMQMYRKEPSAVYCAGVKSMQRTAEVFARFGVPVSMVWGTQEKADRFANMEAFRAGQTKVILNVGVLAYGWDFPGLRNIFAAAPSRSLPGIEQRMGRGTRPLAGVLKPGMNAEERLAAIAASDKPHFNYYDLTATMSGFRLASAVDIFDRASQQDETRRQRMTQACAGEEVDILEVVEKTAKEIEKEALREAERQAALVGFSFEKEEVDPFAEKEERQRGWRIFWGPFRGKLMREVPDGVIRSHLQKSKPGSEYRRALRSELDRREAVAC